jgi:riboflavin kinase/FMN adenylyltransferase
MTPDAAFGYERRGTPTTLATLGAADGFDVVVIPPFTIDGEEVRSSAIRTAITTGDLAAAERLLGRPVTITGSIPGSLTVGADGLTEIELVLPLALPPDGDYAAIVDGSARALRIVGGTAAIVGSVEPGRISAALVDG